MSSRDGYTVQVDTKSTPSPRLISRGRVDPRTQPGVGTVLQVVIEWASAIAADLGPRTKLRIGQEELACVCAWARLPQARAVLAVAARALPPPVAYWVYAARPAGAAGGAKGLRGRRGRGGRSLRGASLWFREGAVWSLAATTDFMGTSLSWTESSRVDGA